MKNNFDYIKKEIEKFFDNDTVNKVEYNFYKLNDENKNNFIKEFNKVDFNTYSTNRDLVINNPTFFTYLFNLM